MPVNKLDNLSALSTINKPLTFFKVPFLLSLVSSGPKNKNKQTTLLLYYSPYYCYPYNKRTKIKLLVQYDCNKSKNIKKCFDAA